MSVRAVMTVVACSVASFLGGIEWERRQVSPNPSPASPEVVAMVGGEEIRAEALRLAMARLAAANPSAAIEEVRRQALDGLIRTAVLAAAARKAGLETSTEIKDAYRNLLADKFWHDVALRKLSVPSVQDADVRKVWEEEKRNHWRPARARALGLFLRYPDNAGDTDRADVLARARKLREQAMAGGAAAFRAISRDQSSDPTLRRNGGDLGWIQNLLGAGQLPDPVTAQLFTLRSGEVSEVVAVDRGVWFVRAEELLPEGYRDFNEVSAEIRRRLSAAREAEAEKRAVSDLRRGFAVDLYGEAIEKVGGLEQDLTAPPQFPIGSSTRAVTGPDAQVGDAG